MDQKVSNILQKFTQVKRTIQVTIFIRYAISQVGDNICTISLPFDGSLNHLGIG